MGTAVPQHARLHLKLIFVRERVVKRRNLNVPTVECGRDCASSRARATAARLSRYTLVPSLA